MAPGPRRDTGIDSIHVPRVRPLIRNTGESLIFEDLTPVLFSIRVSPGRRVFEPMPGCETQEAPERRDPG